MNAAYFKYLRLQRDLQDVDARTSSTRQAVKAAAAERAAAHDELLAAQQSFLNAINVQVQHFNEACGATAPGGQPSAAPAARPKSVPVSSCAAVPALA